MLLAYASSFGLSQELLVRAIGYASTSQTVTIGADTGLWINAMLQADPTGMVCNLAIIGVGVPVPAKSP